MTKEKKNNFSDDDKDLWETVSKKTKKYEKTNRIVFNNKPEIRIPIQKQVIEKTNKRESTFTKEKNKKEMPLVNIKGNLETLDPKEIPTGISLKQAQDIKKGKFRPEKVYDLHGYTQYGAHNYLNEEIIKCYKRNIRTLLIITGKKLGASGAEGVLKKEVPRWLNLSPLREVILMTSWAAARDGGDGALYVLLKRYKEIKY